MLDEVIPKQQLVAVILKTFFRHVDTMCARPRLGSRFTNQA
jgi:hypothetical protein